MSEDGDGVVYTKSGAVGDAIRVYHTDRECQALKHPAIVEVRERSLASLAGSVRECQLCRGDHPKNTPNFDCYQALVDASPDDLRTDGGQDDPGRPPRYDPMAYRDAVHDLYQRDETNETGGVPPGAVAEALDVPESTARYHLNGLVERGELGDVFGGVASPGPPARGFVPREDDCVLSNFAFDDGGDG